MNALEVVDDKSEISEVPALDEEFLAFLAQAESVDETFLDPLDMLEMDELDENEPVTSKAKLGDELENKKIKSENEFESDLKSHDSKMNSQLNRTREEER